MSASFFVVGDDDAAFAGGDLFVRIEAEDAAAAEGAGLAALVGGAQGFAGILNEGDLVAGGEHGDLVHADGIAKGLDAENGLGFGGDGFFGFGGIEVKGLGVDVHKHGGGTYHFDDIRRCDKREGRGKDFVARADAHGEEAAVEAGGAGIDGYGFVNVEVIAECVFKLGAFGAEGEVSGSQDVNDGLDFGIGDVGAGERDLDVIHGQFRNNEIPRRASSAARQDGYYRHALAGLNPKKNVCERICECRRAHEDECFVRKMDYEWSAKGPTTACHKRKKQYWRSCDRQHHTHMDRSSLPSLA